MSVRIEAHSEPIAGYKLLDRLGSGGFGEVWRCEAPGGIYKAVKIIFGDLRSQNNDLLRYAEQELKSLKRVKAVRHPYLLTLDRYDIVDGRLMIVMELADCNLWDRFRACREQGMIGIPRDELLMYMAEAAEVLDLMNDQHGLQHLDIKPQNLFMLHNHVKVADFGQVKDLQGVLASVTGGITPVYAAPETFDGVVSRFCDQYSLACVYQELLTGQRPFDGTSMGQLLMQHLQLPPNLAPSPACDRPILLRALSKKPDDRWPNVASFVKALRDPYEQARASSVFTTAFASRSIPDDSEHATPSQGAVSSLSLETPFPQSMAETDSHQPVFTPAPSEVTGDGPLRPAVIIGIGQSGMRVLQRFRYELTERYGPPDHLPLVRTVFIDTDEETFEQAARAKPHYRLAALDSKDFCHAKLNRAGHYLKPRLNGRSLLEGWFDQQMLYKIPRVPQTMGLRLFGRLAFCDHYRPLIGRIHAELEESLAPDALQRMEQQTGLRRRTNRPRVYIIAGLGGGSGSGMFLDVAYATRARLKRMGYENPDVVGLLVVPPVDGMLAAPLALGNTYAALTELSHFMRPGTVFTASYDERNGQMREKDPPFTRCYLIPGSGPAPTSTKSGSGVIQKPRSATPTGISQPDPRAVPGSGSLQKPGSRVIPCAPARTEDSAQATLQPYSDIAELLRLELFTPLGRLADEARAECPKSQSAVEFSTFGLTAFEWPRAEVVNRTTAAVVRSVMKHWTAPNLKRAREVVPGWAAVRWTQLGLEADVLRKHLQNVMEQAIGARVEEQIEVLTDPLVPRGWLARLPEPEKVTLALNSLLKLLGSPVQPPKRDWTPGESAVLEATKAAAEGYAVELSVLGRSLAENPQFRFAGAEEVLRQFLATTDRLLIQHLEQATDGDAKAMSSFEALVHYTHLQRGMRKPQPAEFTETLRQFPRTRFRAFLDRRLAEIYRSVRDALARQLTGVLESKNRLEAAVALDPESNPAERPAGPRRLLPPGCLNIQDTVDRFLAVVQEEDVLEIDRRVQSALEPEIGGLFQACYQSATGAEEAIRVLREETRAFLDSRLGEVDLGAMFAERFRSRQVAEAGVNQAYAESAPAWIGNGPWAANEIVVASAPGGEPGQAIRELLLRAISLPDMPIAESRDDVTILREYPSVPISALPHLGPAGVSAYRTLPETHQCSLHSRLDVTQWADIDAD